MNGNLDGSTHNVEIQRSFSCTGTLHFQLETGTHLSAKHLADFLVVLPGKVFSVNLHQNISGFQILHWQQAYSSYGSDIMERFSFGFQVITEPIPP